MPSPFLWPGTLVCRIEVVSASLCFRFEERVLYGPRRTDVVCVGETCSRGEMLPPAAAATLLDPALPFTFVTGLDDLAFSFLRAFTCLISSFWVSSRRSIILRSEMGLSAPNRVRLVCLVCACRDFFAVEMGCAWSDASTDSLVRARAPSSVVAW